MLVPTGMSLGTRPAATPGDVASLVKNLLVEQILTLEQIIQATYVSKLKLPTNKGFSHKIQIEVYERFASKFDKNIIIPIVFRGFSNPGINACFINAYLLFAFEFIRHAGYFFAGWNNIVDDVVKNKTKGIHSLICNMYNSTYNRMESTGIGEKGKKVVEALLELDYSDSKGVYQNDVFMFGSIMSDIFDSILQPSYWPFHEGYTNTPIRCFEFPQLQDFDMNKNALFLRSDNEFVTFGQLSTETKKTFMIENYKLSLVQFIEHLSSGHYVFYRRLTSIKADKWLRYSDDTVSYYEDLNISKMKIVLSCYSQQYIKSIS